MSEAQALYQFFAGFSWPAYDENTVPDDAVLPYITYETAVSSFGEPTAINASLWDRSMSWKTVQQKADQIMAALDNGGFVSTDNRLWIKMGTPFQQRMAEPEDYGIRRIVLNLEAEFLN